MVFTLPQNRTSTLLSVDIQSITKDSFQEAVQLLARAFVNEPVSVAVYPRFSDARRVQALTVDFNAELNLCMRRGCPVIAKFEAQVVGAAVIYPPGKFPLPLIDQWYLLLSSFIGNGFYNLKDWLAWLKDVDKHHPREPHYYLEYIGVDPEYQGHGVGSTIVQHLVEKAGRKRVGCYLETADPRNTLFYERFGFKVVDAHEVIGVPTWFMWRPPTK